MAVDNMTTKPKTNREKVLAYLQSMTDADYPLDTEGIRKATGIKTDIRYLMSRLAATDIIKWDDTYKGWRLAPN